MSKLAINALILLLTACSPTPPLSVFTEYLSVEALPSYRIGTPDPRLYCPEYGEKLHISWNIPEECSAEMLHLNLFLRFGNGEDQMLDFSLAAHKGTLIVPLLNDEYWKKEGIFTFKIELFLNEKLYSEWRHQLWADRIIFNQID